MLTCLNSLNRRGALFGVDARIALAIFAGLAVIAGAMIYKVASQTRYTAVVAEMSNISKAFGDYVLDVGMPPSQIEDLISSSVPGWNGPYLPYKDTPGSNLISVHAAGRTVVMSIRYGNSAAWPSDGRENCDPGDCWGWLYFASDLKASEIEAIDKQIDGVASTSQGLMRYEDSTPDGSPFLYRLGSVRRPGN